MPIMQGHENCIHYHIGPVDPDRLICRGCGRFVYPPELIEYCRTHLKVRAIIEEANAYAAQYNVRKKAGR